MDLGLRGRAALVTGGASGIGLASVRALAAEGARVAVIDALAGDEAPAALVRIADVTDEPRLAAAVDEAAEALGGLDVVVACAGISGPVGTPAHEVDRDAWERVLAVNATGAFLLAKHAHRWLRRAADPAIVLLGSDSSFVAAPGMAPYCASKGALLMLAKALAVDFAQDGIRVNCLCPSVVDTPLARADLGQPDGFAGAAFPVIDPAQVARHVLFLASPASSPVNGAALVADHGGLARSTFPA